MATALCGQNYPAHLQKCANIHTGGSKLTPVANSRPSERGQRRSCIAIFLIEKRRVAKSAQDSRGHIRNVFDSKNTQLRLDSPHLAILAGGRTIAFAVTNEITVRFIPHLNPHNAPKDTSG